MVEWKRGWPRRRLGGAVAPRTILVVEDEQDIRDILQFNLEKEGFQVRTAADGGLAVAAVRSELPDLVLLDLMLPGLDGLEVCRRLKRDPATSAVPIIMVTARGEERDVVAGLELGAEDYIAKPFAIKVLIARVRAALRRRREPPAGQGAVLSVHDIEINPGRHEVRVQGVPVEMTFSELRILHCLARRPGWVMTRQQIVDAVRGGDYPVTDRSIDVQIVGIRRKLGSRAEVIETVRGVGYRFREPS